MIHEERGWIICNINAIDDEQHLAMCVCNEYSQL